MFGEYDVRWFLESDMDDYIRGLNETLYDRYDEGRFRWKFLKSPYGLGFLSIVVVEEKKREGQSASTLFSLSGACGLFTETIGFMSMELAEKGPRILIGFNFE